MHQLRISDTDETVDAEQAPRTQWGNVMFPGLQCLLALPIILLHAVAVLLLAALWICTGAYSISRIILLRNGTLDPAKRQQRSLLQTLPLVYVAGFVSLLWVPWMLLLRHIMRPRFVFVVYSEDMPMLSRLASDVQYHVFHLQSLPVPVACPIALIFSRAGLGMCATMLPCLSHMDDKKRLQIPACMQAAFPYTKSFALAGRLPGLLAGLQAPVQPPFVDGVHGTLFTMLAAANALQRHTCKPLDDTCICVLGGGGYIGTRLVRLLRQQTASSQCSGYKHVTCLDSRYASRHLDHGILYTSEPCDLIAADVVLVITACGNNCAAYLPYARPGQVWGDDTHPEMGHRVVQGLREQGVLLFKLYNTGGCGARFLPRLPGFPAHSIPGCLLMALVQQECGEEALKDFETFNAAAKRVGFRCTLGQHSPWFD